MFDAGKGCDSASSAEPADERPSRRQYTLKGVEAETIQLMRHAASREGMKIGSWVSLRMREAAERALSRERSNKAVVLQQPSPDSGEQSAQSAEFGQILANIFLLIDAEREVSNRRFIKLEQELHEITKGQRTILSALLAERNA